jgi:prepilin-type N-terminal cleavage/methylation domain-containing protein
MKTPTARIARRLRAQDGFTIVELVVAMALALVVVGAPLTFLIVSMKQQDSISSRAYAARQAQTALEQLTRDLREAISTDTTGATYNVTVSSSGAQTSISFEIPGGATGSTGVYGFVPDASQSVTWTCPNTSATTAGNCTRALGGSSRVEVTGINSATFSPTSSSGAAMSLPATNPAYVGVALSVQASTQNGTTHSQAAAGDSNPILVQGGVDLRNLS